MIMCANCKSQQIIGALFCVECGAQLDPAAGWSTTEFSPSDDWAKDIKKNIDAPVTNVVKSRLGLHLYSYEAYIQLDENREYSFGRVNEGQTVLPDIDLSPYDGFSNGISRIHAAISLTESKIEVKDLGSSNGTLLNGRKLTPHVPYALRHGDVLIFGKLQARVLVGPGSNGS